MKAQAQAAPVVLRPGQDPMPPVIIKIGGGSEPPDSVPINIDSGLISWTDDTGEKWNDAWTTRNCQIFGLNLQDGRDPDTVLCKIHPEKDALTTLTLYFKASDKDTFAISEVPGEDGSIYVAAKSSGLFKVMHYNPDGSWTISEAVFLSDLVKIEFRQRRIGDDDDLMKFEYRIKSDYIELGLDFNQM